MVTKKKKTHFKTLFYINFGILILDFICYTAVPDEVKGWFFMLIIYQAVTSLLMLAISTKLGEWNEQSVDNGRSRNNDR